MSDDQSIFDDRLFDLQRDMIEAVRKQRDAALDEARRLHAVIAAFPSTVTEMQDRIVMLEQRVRELESKR